MHLLASALKLRPLDRLQINDAAAIRDMQFAPQLGYGYQELPFLYFQRVLADGMLEVCTPNGYEMHVSPADVCDIRRGTPVVVRAMPRTKFIERLKLPHAVAKRTPPGPESYSEAHVLRVMKDRWGRVDIVTVWFLDPSHNDGDRPWNAPIHPDDRQRLDACANRRVMPVLGKGSRGATGTADKGIDAEERLAAHTVRTLVQARLADDAAAVATIASLGDRPVTHASLNKMVPLRLTAFI